MNVVYTRLFELARLSWLAGPILDKELRVQSRRRRSYVLRSAYVGLLILLIAAAWLVGVSAARGKSTVYTMSRMGEVGKNIVLTMTWFQFFAAQIVAVVLLSDSFSEEIRRGTLDVLRTTPISSFQIVAGKLLSKLVQVILLVALSLPLLALVRTMGGVPWDYVVASLAITFTATLFVGSVSMLLSIRTRRPYLVIIAMLVIIFTGYYIVQIICFGLRNSTVSSVLALLHPALALTRVTTAAFPGPRWALAGFSGGSFSWPAHCFIVVLASLVVTSACVFGIRREALVPSLHKPLKKRRALRSRISMVFGGWGTRRRDPAAFISGVVGSPVLWKELGGPFSVFLRAQAGVTILLFLLLFLTYIIDFITRSPIWSSMYSSCLWLIGCVRTATMAATAITKEKERRTWQILLATPIEDGRIIRDKAAAVLFRNLPLWLVVAVHSAAFWLILGLLQRQPLYRMNLLHVASGLVSVPAVVTLLVGTGLYFSVRMKSNTTAVISTVGVLLGVFVGQRFLYSIVFAVFASAISAGPYLFVTLNILFMMLYIPVGLLLLWHSKYRLRADMFKVIT